MRENTATLCHTSDWSVLNSQVYSPRNTIQEEFLSLDWMVFSNLKFMSEYLLSAFIRPNWELLLGRPIYRSQLRSHHFKGPYHTRPSTHLHATTHILIHHSPWRELHITDKTHTLFVSSPKSYASFSIHTPQPALRYCIISSRRIKLTISNKQNPDYPQLLGRHLSQESVRTVGGLWGGLVRKLSSDHSHPDIL